MSMSESERMVAPIRVLVSYAHDDARHRARVRTFAELLRENGIDARLDLPAAERPQEWPLWMLRQIRVVYSASGMYLAAAILTNADAIVEHKLYWGAAESLDEGRYLTAMLNSTTLTLAVRPLLGRGEHNARDFDKHVWRLPIPAYDPGDSAHRWLVACAERAEEMAAGVELPAVRFEVQRRSTRRPLEDDGVAADIDAIVKELLG